MQNLPKIFRLPEMYSFGKISAQDFQMAAITKILMRQENQLRRFFPWGISDTVSRKHKTLETQNAHGDYDATIAKAAAAVTHVQSLSQEVGSGDERPGLFSFYLSSVETDFWWLGEEQSSRNRNQYTASTWGHGFRRSWRI